MQLTVTGRASVIERSGKRFWVATERLHLIGDVLADRARLDGFARAGDGCIARRNACVSAGRNRSRAAEARIGRPGDARPVHSPDLAEGETEWCNRRVLARIHRLTLGQLRREIEPVTAAQFQRFLFRWQHLHPRQPIARRGWHAADHQAIAGLRNLGRGLGSRGAVAAAWRATSRSFSIDLCLSGEVMWARLSPHPAFEAAEPRRVRPTRTAPIAIFLRESADWLAAPCIPNAKSPVFSHAAREVLDADSNSAGRRSLPIWCAPPAGWRAKWRTGSGNWWPRAW